MIYTDQRENVNCPPRMVWNEHLENFCPPTTLSGFTRKRASEVSLGVVYYWKIMSVRTLKFKIVIAYYNQQQISIYPSPKKNSGISSTWHGLKGGRLSLDKKNYNVILTRTPGTTSEKKLHRKEQSKLFTVFSFTQNETYISPLPTNS